MKHSVRALILGAAILLVASAALANTASVKSGFPPPPSFLSDVKMKMSFKNEEVTTIIEAFSKASKTTFVVDPGVRGRISVFTPNEVDLNEAFDLMSTSLALNGFAIVPREGRYVVMAARNASRSSIETMTDAAPSKPERYVTRIFSVKHLPVEELHRSMRILPSKDGEMTSLTKTNQIVVTDFISNVNRIGDILTSLDKPVSSDIAKLVKASEARPPKVSKSETPAKN